MGLKVQRSAGVAMGSRSNEAAARKVSFQSCIERRLEKIQQLNNTKKVEAGKMEASKNLGKRVMRVSFAMPDPPRPQAPVGGSRP